MSEIVGTVIGLLGVIFFLHWWGMNLRSDTIWMLVMRYISIAIPFSLVIPLLGYIESIQGLVHGSGSAALTGEVGIFYAVYMWVYIIFIAFLMVSFFVDVLNMMGGKKGKIGGIA